MNWIAYDLSASEASSKSLSVKEQLKSCDAAITCIGNIQPSQEWKQLWGLGFDDERLYEENGIWHEKACDIAESVGCKRMILFGVNYETAKCLEGPIEGYIDGKRHAESVACKKFGLNNTISIGLPPIMYGGQRFVTFGPFYRKFVESSLSKRYVKCNQMLRNLSVAPLEDWVEEMIMSPPVNVEVVVRVAVAAALGKITKEVVGKPRIQGFYDQNGKSVQYPDLVSIDGCYEIERIAEALVVTAPKLSFSKLEDASNEEGALTGKLPYLYPIPVTMLFASIFYSVATEKFVQVAATGVASS